MKLKEVVRAAKASFSSGAWTDDKLKAKDFPLSKKRGKVFPLTRRWRWNVTKFQIEAREFRILTAYHTLVPEFMTILSENLGSDSRIIARYEFHGSHDGWHGHLYCDDIDLATAEIVKPVGTTRIPTEGTYHRNCVMLLNGREMDDNIAYALSASLFGLPHTPDFFASEAVPWPI